LDPASDGNLPNAFSRAARPSTDRLLTMIAWSVSDEPNSV
jgi:hypothetical protein